MKAVARTHPGQKRSNNEDAVFADPTLGLLMVSDGMGGHEAGEVASAICVERVSAFVQASRTGQIAGPLPFSPDQTLAPETNRLLMGVRVANAEVRRVAAERPAARGMGATLDAVMLAEGHAHIVHVGDSRVYRLRNQMLERLTVDHNESFELVEMGLISPQEAEQRTGKQAITRAMGGEEHVRAHTRTEPVTKGDMFLLCSDGLSDVVNDLEIVDRMSRFAQAPDLAPLADGLINYANQRGGPDNISVVLARVD